MKVKIRQIRTRFVKANECVFGFRTRFVLLTGNTNTIRLTWYSVSIQNYPLNFNTTKSKILKEKKIEKMQRWRQMKIFLCDDDFLFIRVEEKEGD